MTDPTSSPLREPFRPGGPATAPGEVGVVPGPADPRPYDTQPIPLIPAAEPTPAVAPVLLIRAGLALLAMVAALVAAVLLYRHGLSEHVYPSFLAGTDHTDVVRYRGPWIGGAALAMLIAGLLALQAVKDLRRRARG